MTLSETLIAAVLLGLLLVGLALGMTTIRTELKRRQAADLLATLDAALSTYHAATGQWPLPERRATTAEHGPPRPQPAGSLSAAAPQPAAHSEPVPAGEPRHRSLAGGSTGQSPVPHGPAAAVTAAALAAEGERFADEVIAIMLELPESRQVLEKVPEVLRLSVEDGSSARGSSGDGASSAAGGGRHAWSVQDAWGRQLICLTPASSRPRDRQAVAANGGRPIFISAGEDGRFGMLDLAFAADNLRSDEAQGMTGLHVDE